MYNSKEFYDTFEALQNGMKKEKIIIIFALDAHELFVTHLLHVSNIYASNESHQHLNQRLLALQNIWNLFFEIRLWRQQHSYSSHERCRWDSLPMYKTKTDNLLTIRLNNVIEKANRYPGIKMNITYRQ